MTAPALAAVPPGLVLIAAGAVLPLLAPGVRRVVVLAAPLLALALAWRVQDGAAPTLGLLGHVLTPVAGSALGRLFATVFAVMAFGGALYGLTTARTIELSAALVHAGAAIGVSLAGDLVTLTVFWEVMAGASTVLIWAGGTAAARAAGLRYLMVHLLGGVLLMAGVAMLAGADGTIGVGRLALDGPGPWLVLAGVLVNAGAPPLSAWLPDAYP